MSAAFGPYAGTTKARLERGLALETLPPAVATAAIEQRRQALIAARTVAIANRDWAEMNEITKRLAKLPVKGEKDYPR